MSGDAGRVGSAVRKGERVPRAAPRRRA